MANTLLIVDDDYILRDELKDVLDLIRIRPPKVTLVLTGNDADPEVIKAADLVTEMKSLKHPFEKGIPAIRGVDY